MVIPVEYTPYEASSTSIVVVVILPLDTSSGESIVRVCGTESTIYDLAFVHSALIIESSAIIEIVADALMLSILQITGLLYGSVRSQPEPTHAPKEGDPLLPDNTIFVIGLSSGEYTLN